MFNQSSCVSTCQICLHSTSRYTCPRCQTPYCSIACYKGHSTKCVDEFNKEQVFDSLRRQRVTIGEKKEFEKILNKFHKLNLEDLSENKDNDEESEQSEIDENRFKHLVQLAEENKLDLNNLTAKESKLFFEDLNNGLLNEHIDHFNPWWNKISSEGGAEHIKHICCARSHQANPRNSFTTIYSIFCYAHLIRSCHGNWSDDLNFTITHLNSTCRLLLDASPPPQTINETVEKILLLTSNNDYQLFSDSILNQICFVDTKQILSFKDFCLKSLQELNKIFSMSERELKSDTQIRTKFKRSIRKLDFLCSFVAHHWDYICRTSSKFEMLIGSLDLLNLINADKTTFDINLGSKPMR